MSLSLNKVWALIDPVEPDCLEDLGNGIIEASWWKPVPLMDIEILSRTENIIVQGNPYEPRALPNGLAVRFMIAGHGERSDQINELDLSRL